MLSTSDGLSIVVYQPKRYMDKSTVSQIRSHAQKTVQHRKIVAETRTEAANHRENKSEDTLPSPSLLPPPSPAQRSRTRDQVAFMHLRAPNLGHMSLGVESTVERELAGWPICVSTELAGARTYSRVLFPTQTDALFMHLVDRSYGIWEWSQPRGDFVRSTLKEGGIYHSLLALAYYVYHRQTRKAIYHENATITYVSQRLSQSIAYTDNVDVWNILTWCVCRLILIAYERRDLEAVSSHLNGVVTMLDCFPIIGPTEAWPQWQTIIGGVLLLSLPTWHTLPSVLQKIPSLIRTTACEDVELLGYTIDTTWLTDEQAVLDVLSPEMVDILQALHTICSQPRPNKVAGPRQPVSFAQHAVRLALRAVRIEVDRKYKEPSHGMALRKCLCLIMVIIGWESSYPIVASSTAIEHCRVQARKILSRDSSFDVTKLHGYTELSESLFVWVVLMMGATSREMTEQSYYIRLLCAKFSHLTHQELEDFERMNYMVGWCKPHFGKRVELFWVLVQSEMLENVSC